jgi:ATP-dependent helicase/nuclease subunit A
MRPIAVLSHLLEARHRELPSRLLQIADRLTGYTAVLANLAGAARREADWRGFVEHVRKLEHGSEALFTAVRRLRRLLLAEAEVPRPPVEAEGAVALMSIHRAKGLEWPVVVIPDLSRSASARAEPVAFDPELGVALKLRSRGDEPERPALFTILDHRQKRRDEAEAGRLLYVALTRARDHLILSAADEDGGSLDLLLPGLQSIGISPQPIPFTADEARPPHPPEPALPALLDCLLTEP